jgi:hypothetical protein
VKIRRDLKSPWGVRVYYDPPEFEAMMDELLFRAGPGVFREGSGVDIDLVLFKACDLEADYVHLPDGILGRTLFHEDGRPEIQISRPLADDAETDRLARRRLRTTLAHECGHVACHQPLFVTDTETLSLFGEEEEREEKPAILCREPSLGGYRGDWWEFQANQCMAAVLLPKRFLVPRVGNLFASLGVADFLEALAKGLDEEFIRSVANTFDVSWQAAVLRLQGLGFVPSAEGSSQGEVAF